jgi:hypothetical protein
MTEYAWSGTGVADGLDFTDTNSNTPGNGDTVATGITKATGTTGFIRYARPAAPAGSGLSVAGIVGDTLRIDPINPGAIGHSLRFIYTPSDVITTAECAIAVSRNNNATAAASTAFIVDQIGAAVGQLTVRANTNQINLASTPALIRPHSYQIDWTTLLNTTATPTTSNGRIIFRVRDLTNAGSWNAGAEVYYDSGYTISVTVDTQERFRLGKTSSGAVMPQTYFTGIRWRDLTSTTANTSTVKANAITNFVQDAGPAITTTGTGEHYVIRAVSNPLVGGAMAYSIIQLSGVNQTPVNLSPGIWIVDADTSAPLSYSVTASETGGSSSTIIYNVPMASTSTSGAAQTLTRVGGVWQ